MVTATAKIPDFNCKTVSAYYREDAGVFIERTRKETAEFKLDESFFGARKGKDKQGRGAAGKTPVFGLLKKRKKACSSYHELPSKELRLLQGKFSKIQ